MPDFPNLALAQQHFDDVETNLHFRILQPAQIIQGGLRKQPAFARIHGRSGADPIFGRAGFHFHEHQTIRVTKNEIHFAAIGAEVRGEKFKTLSFEMLFRRALTEFAVEKMKRFFRVWAPTLRGVKACS